jgi:hypothetical protein
MGKILAAAAQRGLERHRLPLPALTGGVAQFPEKLPRAKEPSAAFRAVCP